MTRSARPSVVGMDDEAAISRLPKTHASALRLRARGFDDDAIAMELALEPGASGCCSPSLTRSWPR